MTRPLRTIALDLDGVFAEFNTPFVRVLRDAGASLRPWPKGHDPECWHWPQRYGATYEQEQAAWAAVAPTTFEGELFWMNLPLHRDVTSEVITALDWLATQHSLVFVTGRPSGAASATRRWIEHKLGLAHDQFEVIVTPEGRKAPILSAIGASVLVEDSLSQVRQCAIAPCRTYLVDRAYNQGECSSAIRVPSTLAALRQIEEL